MGNQKNIKNKSIKVGVISFNSFDGNFAKLDSSGFSIVVN
jgi:hypothetical protein